jgi:hypothetical protein
MTIRANKLILRADAVKFEAYNDTLDVNSQEEWTQIKDVASFQVWLDKDHSPIDMNDNKNQFMINSDTSYSASALDSYVLIRKQDITKISVDSGKDPKFYSSYENASLVIDLSDVSSGDTRFVADIDEDKPISIKNSLGIRSSYTALKNYLDQFTYRNVKNLDLSFNFMQVSTQNPTDSTEVQMVQDLHTFITQNNTLESVCISLNDNTN